MKKCIVYLLFAILFFVVWFSSKQQLKYQCKELVYKTIKFLNSNWFGWLVQFLNESIWKSICLIINKNIVEQTKLGNQFQNNIPINSSAFCFGSTFFADVVVVVFSNFHKIFHYCIQIDFKFYFLLLRDFYFVMYHKAAIVFKRIYYKYKKIIFHSCSLLCAVLAKCFETKKGCENICLYANQRYKL